MTNLSPASPEARRKRHEKAAAGKGWLGLGTRSREVIKRTAVGVYNEGFIHAGNLAYLSLLTIFPFVIVAAAIARLFGQTGGGLQTFTALLQTMPPDVAGVLSRPVQDVIAARSGSLLWLGAIVGLWTTGSFIETIRDIVRRAYGVAYSRPFWEYRLTSIGIIVASVVIALVAFAFSVFLSGIQKFVVELIPGAEEIVSLITLLKVVPGLMLFGSLYLIFFTLTPRRYRRSNCKKWPGAAFVALWWIGTTTLLPVALTGLGGYDLTYGSLAGVMITLIFFFVIGFGLVIGAHLNAALADIPDEELVHPRPPPQPAPPVDRADPGTAQPAR